MRESSSKLNSLTIKQTQTMKVIQGGDKKVMKKSLSIVLVLTLVLSMFASVVSANTGLTAQEKFDALKAKGIFEGDGTGANLDGDMTREQLAKILALLAGLSIEAEGQAKATGFSDVSVDRWSARFVNAVKKANLMEGTSDTTFDPAGKVTVEQLATVFARAWKLDVTSTTVSGNVSEWAKGFVAAAIKAGLISASSDYTTAAKRSALVDAAYTTYQALNPVTIKSIAAVADVTVIQDQVPVLPNTVTVTKSDNTVENIAVTWDALSTALAGTFVVQGTIEKSDLKPAVKVVVTEKALAVESVTPVNGKEIKVTFNKTVQEGTGTNGAANTANYDISSSAPVSVALSTDKKSVTLTTSTNLTHNTAYTVTVKKEIYDASGKSLGTANYVTSIFFVDATKPTVTSVDTQSNGDIKLTFSEKVVDQIPSIYINGIPVTATAVSTGSTSVTIPKNNFAPFSPINGSSYPIYVSGYQDLVTTPNVMALYVGSFVYNQVADLAPPVVTSLVAKDEKTLTLVFSEAVSAPDITIKKGVAATPINWSASTSDSKTFTITLDQSNNTLYNGAASPKETSASLTVTVSGYKDSANNLGQSYSANLITTKDTTAPVVTSSTYDLTNQKFVITLDKGLLAANDGDQSYSANITITNTNGVLSNSPTAAQIIDTLVGGKTIEIDNSVANGGMGLAAGTYSITIPAGAVKDQSLNGGNANAQFTVAITIPSSATDSTKPSVTSVSSSAIDQLTVNFTEQVKGGTTVGSATDPGNYLLNNTVLPTGTIITLNSTRNIATITLPSGSITATETRLITVSGIQDLAGNLMNLFTTTVALTDSAKPVLVSASVDSNGALILTFSENVDGKLDTAGHLNPDVTDFVIKVNGITVNDGGLAAGSTDLQVKITSPTISFATGTITVATKSGILTTVDAAGNKLKSDTTVTVVR